jgi:uncharacterized protein (TIGR03083 family)
MRPVQLVGLFPDLHQELMTLLRGLAPQDWNRATACAAWSVQDIVAHLLDTCFRRLSLGRDQTEIAPPRPLSSYDDLVAFLNQLNAEWVIAARRLSPRMLMDLMDWAEPQLHRYLESLDSEETARFGVAWAGEEHSPNWFDIGREYTERWLHQQQIREAVGAPGLSSRRWLFPVLDIFVRALPFRYRNVPADPEATVQFEITGEAGGSWALVRTGGAWNLFAGSVSHPLARVTLDQDTAWKLFSKGLSSDQARRDIRFEGDAGLGQPVLGALAVMA